MTSQSYSRYLKVLRAFSTDYGSVYGVVNTNQPTYFIKFKYFVLSNVCLPSVNYDRKSFLLHEVKLADNREP